MSRNLCAVRVVVLIDGIAASGGGFSVQGTGSAEDVAGTKSSLTTSSTGNSSSSASTTTDTTSTAASTYSTSGFASTGSSVDETSGGIVTGSTSTTGEPAECHPVVAEVLNRSSGSDSGRGWIKLYNPCSGPVDVSQYALGWGRGSFNVIDLQGMIAADGCSIIGGPTSAASNFDPPIDQVFEFDPQLCSDGRVFALYDLEAAALTVTTLLVDVVLYGNDSDHGFLDPTGVAPAPYIGRTDEDASIQRTSIDRTFMFLDPANPGACPGY